MESNSPPRIVRYHQCLGVALAIYWSALFVGTHIPSPDQFLPQAVSDKLLHFSAYCGLAVLFGLWRSTPDGLTLRTCLIGLVLLAAYAVADELLQGLPQINRDTDLLDWLADVAGIVTGFAAVRGLWCVLGGSNTAAGGKQF